MLSVTCHLQNSLSRTLSGGTSPETLISEISSSSSDKILSRIDAALWWYFLLDAQYDGYLRP